MKLSKTQKEVIRFMRETGREIYHSSGLNSSCGFSGGGVKMSLATFYVLDNIGIIEKIHKPERSLLIYYQLTELGKTIQL